MRKKRRNQISEISQVRSSPEFVGVRRSSSGFVGAEFLRENAVAKVEKVVEKNAILTSECCFPCVLGAKNVKTHVGNV